MSKFQVYSLAICACLRVSIFLPSDPILGEEKKINFYAWDEKQFSK